jgi:copper oxidase (laccase) domain-containing protein
MSLPELSLADVVQPAWNVAPRVRALVTTRNGGVSDPPFGRWRDGVDLPGGLNLGMKAGDDPAAVTVNRARLLALAGVSEAAWLEQIHGAGIVRAEDVLAQAHANGMPTQADASVTDRPGTVCVVMVADCMPVLLCDEAALQRASSNRPRSALPISPAWRPRRCTPISARRSDRTHSR